MVNSDWLSAWFCHLINKPLWTRSFSEIIFDLLQKKTSNKIGSVKRYYFVWNNYNSINEQLSQPNPQDVSTKIDSCFYCARPIFECARPALTVLDFSLTFQHQLTGFILVWKPRHRLGAFSLVFDLIKRARFYLNLGQTWGHNLTPARFFVLWFFIY